MTPPDESNGTPDATYADGAQRYLLESRIATGGMGEVWRARDTVLNRPVAVKLLKHEFADDALFRTRFETEARHAGALHHPGIASVFDFGQAEAADGSGSPRPYLVMELVEGQPLSALLRPGAPMDAAAAQDLLAQAGDALGAAHRAGIVHRDVKPANLIVTPDRKIKITDFGIARAADGVALTQTGQVMGTPQYLSPEQAEGREAGPASDVYSLGVVAYECLAGRRPFDAGSPVANALAHVREPVPELPSSVPADLASVVRRSLSKDPADRYADGAALATALRSPAGTPPPTAVMTGAAATQVMATGAPVPASAPTPPGEDRDEKRRGMAWWPWALLALALLVALIVLLNLSDDDPATRQGRTQPSETPSETATSSPTQEPETTSSPSPTPTESETTEEPDTVEVDEDDYVGRDRKEVEEELKDLGLKPKSEAVDNDGSHEEDTVASLDPTGTLEEGDEIQVFYYDKAPDEDGNNGGGNGGGNGGEGNDEGLVDDLTGNEGEGGE